MLYNAFKAPLLVMIVAGTLVAGLAGLGLGYLTLRLRGVFFAIASLALAVVLFTFVVNWDYVGGARGAYVLQPREVPFGLPRYIHLLYIGHGAAWPRWRCRRARDRDVHDRPRPRGDPRRRARRRMLGRADAAGSRSSPPR